MAKRLWDAGQLDSFEFTPRKLEKVLKVEKCMLNMGNTEHMTSCTLGRALAE